MGTRRHGKARIVTLALALFAGGAAGVAAPVSAAASGSADVVTTAPQIADAQHPIPKIGSMFEGSLARSASTALPRVPDLTEHGETTAKRTGATYTVNADDVTGSIGLRKTLVDYDPIRDCSVALGGKPGNRVIDHYTLCMINSIYYNTVETSTGKIIGTTSWLQITAGQSGAEERAAHFTTSLESFKREGDTGSAPATKKLEVTIGTGGYSGSDGTNKPCSVLGSDANPTTEDVWDTTDRRAVHTVYSSKADGYGRDFISRCAFSTFDRNGSNDWGMINSSGLRQDSADYFWESPTDHKESTSVFDRVIPVMVYSLSSPAHKEVAAHINLAQTHPELTDPKVNGKLIPGSIASGKTLSRLYDKWDTVAGEQKKKNTAAKDKACATIKPSNTNGLDCDEYPFASTWEGAGSGPNFSVKYLDSTQNRSAGSQLGDWYTKDRILHKDSFYVAIDK